MKTLLIYLAVLPILFAVAVALACFDACYRRTAHKFVAGYYHEEGAENV